MYIVLLTISWPNGPAKSIYGPYLDRGEAALAGQRLASHIPAPVHPVVYVVNSDMGVVDRDEQLAWDYSMSRPDLAQRVG